MASTVADRTWRTSTPERVDTDLAEVWREVGRQGHVARAVMSNLIVFRSRHAMAAPRHESPEVDPRLDAVVARHPSKVIVIEHERGAAHASAMDARVCVAVFGPPAARYAIEQIAIRSACAEHAIPSIVRRFVRGTLPTTIWWTEDFSREPPIEKLLEMGRQLLYDSRTWRDVREGLRAASRVARDGDREIDLADLNWRRLGPLRQALAHAGAAVRAEVSAHDVRIEHRPGDGALAWLLNGWLAARLRWPANAWAQIHERRHGDNEALTLTIACGTTTITAALNRHRVLVTQPGAPPLVVGLPHETEADAIASELTSLSCDTALHETLAALTGKLSG